MHLVSDLQPGAAALIQEVIEITDTGSRDEAGPVGVVAPEHPEHPTELIECRAAGGLHRRQTPFAPLQVACRAHGAHPGLDGDDAQAVGHDVVQLPGDLEPLLTDGLLRPLDLPTLTLLGLLGHPGNVGTPGADAVAHEPGGCPGQDRVEGQMVTKWPLPDGFADQERPGRQAGGAERDDRFPPFVAGGDGVEGKATSGAPASNVLPMVASARASVTTIRTGRGISGEERSGKVAKPRRTTGGRVVKRLSALSGYPEERYNLGHEEQHRETEVDRQPLAWEVIRCRKGRSGSRTPVGKAISEAKSNRGCASPSRSLR